MRKKSIYKALLRIIISVLFLFIAWWALSGAIDQIHRVDTFGQQAETVIQIGCAFLSFLTFITTFFWREWAKPIRKAWIFFFAMTAGLSALVWGPPMPHIALIFTVGAFLIAWGMIWALRRLTNVDKDEPTINSA